MVNKNPWVAGKGRIGDEVYGKKMKDIDKNSGWFGSWGDYPSDSGYTVYELKMQSDLKGKFGEIINLEAGTMNDSA